MKGWIRKAAAALAALMCMLFSASCGGKKDGGGGHAFTPSLVYESASGQISFAGWAGGRVIIADREMDENQYWHDVLLSVSEDGSDVRRIELKSHMRDGDSAASGANLWYITEDENIWYYESVFAYHEDGSRADVRGYVCLITPEGELLKEYDITSLFAGSDLYAISGMAEAGGQLYVTNSKNVFRVSETGCEIAAGIDGSAINRLIGTRDGALYVQLSDNTICPVDLSSGKLLEGFKIPDKDEYRSFTINAGEDYDFLFSTQLGIKGFDVGDETAETVVDFTASDFAEGDVYQNYRPAGDGRFVAVPADSGHYRSAVYLLTPKASDGKEKTIITLGCVYLTSGVRSAAALFNRRSADYRVEIINYGENVTESEAITALNADMAAGNIPDMLLLNSMMPYESYINKGIRVDLYSIGDLGGFLKSDELQRNIIETCERGGKLYSVPGSFAIMTMDASPSDIEGAIGEIPGKFTVDDLIAVCSAYPDRAPFANVSRDEFSIFLAYFAFSQYADAEKGVCDFDSEDFIKLLDFAASLPEQSPVQKSGGELTEYEVLKEKRAIFGFTQIDSYKQYWSDRMVSFDGDIELIGFPGREGGPTMPFVALSEIAVCSTAKDIGGCAGFVRFFLGEESQSSSSELPVNRKARAKLAEKSVSDRTMAGVYFVKGMGVTIGNITPEAAAELDGVIDRLDMYVRIDESVGNLMIEEVSAFLSGARTSVETAALIQNRMANMLSERG
ncbi:MAG: extracellular solute-binding protein [Clostridia bacterium]|nr:extracellular solute-binding protein [Clostridia bacterium]